MCRGAAQSLKNNISAAVERGGAEWAPATTFAVLSFSGSRKPIGSLTEDAHVLLHVDGVCFAKQPLEQPDLAVGPPPEDTVAIKQRCRKLRSRVCSRRVSESPSLSASLCCRQIRPAAPATVFPEKRHCFPGPRVEGRLKIISGGAIRNVSGQQSIHYGSLLNRSPGSLQGAIKVTQPLSPPRASRANLAFEDEFIGCVWAKALFFSRREAAAVAFLVFFYTWKKIHWHLKNWITNAECDHILANANLFLSPNGICCYWAKKGGKRENCGRHPTHHSSNILLKTNSIMEKATVVLIPVSWCPTGPPVFFQSAVMSGGNCQTQSRSMCRGYVVAQYSHFFTGAPAPYTYFYILTYFPFHCHWYLKCYTLGF